MQKASMTLLADKIGDRLKMGDTYMQAFNQAAKELPLGSKSKADLKKLIEKELCARMNDVTILLVVELVGTRLNRGETFLEAFIEVAEEMDFAEQYATELRETVGKLLGTRKNPKKTPTAKRS